jgi:hypothetical protein
MRIRAALILQPDPLGEEVLGPATQPLARRRVFVEGEVGNRPLQLSVVAKVVDQGVIDDPVLSGLGQQDGRLTLSSPK